MLKIEIDLDFGLYGELEIVSEVGRWQQKVKRLTERIPSKCLLREQIVSGTSLRGSIGPLPHPIVPSPPQPSVFGPKEALKVHRIQTANEPLATSSSDPPASPHRADLREPRAKVSSSPGTKQLPIEGPKKFDRKGYSLPKQGTFKAFLAKSKKVSRNRRHGKKTKMDSNLNHLDQFKDKKLDLTKSSF